MHLLVVVSSSVSLGPPPPYTDENNQHFEIISSSDSTENSAVQNQSTLMRRFITCTGGIFLVKPADLESIEAFKCPFSANPENPHIMEGKGRVDGEVFKRVKEHPVGDRNYIAQTPDGKPGDLLCIMKKGHQQVDDLYPDAGLNRMAEKIQVICQAEKGIDNTCGEEMPLSQFPEHWHNNCLRNRVTDPNLLYRAQITFDLKDFVIQKLKQTEIKLQSFKFAQQRIEETVEYGRVRAELGIQKADWIKNSIAIDFDSKDKTIASMFENIEAHIMEVEGKFEQLIKENNDKDHVLKGLQESINDLKAKMEAQSTKLNELETKKLDQDLRSIGKPQSLQPTITICNGQFVWKIDNFTEKKEKAASGEQDLIYSDPFYTHDYGYKLCLFVSNSRRILNPLCCKGFSSIIKKGNRTILQLK